MAERLGAGEWTYEVNVDWAKIPDEIVLGDCAAVGVDSKGNVYAFNRGEHPVAVFDNDGNLLRTWGEGVFTRPHGVHVAPDDTIWLTDDGDHTVRHCTLDGKVLLTIGIPGKPAPFMSGEPFHRCTHTALSPDGGHLYISDGYGNARIHKFTPDGKLLYSWGESGTDPGPVQHRAQYLLRPGRLGLCRRPREPPRAGVRRRRQTGRRSGTTCTGPTGMCLGHRARTRCAISARAGRRGRSTATGRISARASASTRTKDHELLARLGKPHAGIAPGQFTSPHGIAVDRRGNIYVGELSGRSWSRFSKGPGAGEAPGDPPAGQGGGVTEQRPPGPRRQAVALGGMPLFAGRCATHTAAKFATFTGYGSRLGQSSRLME